MKSVLYKIGPISLSLVLLALIYGKADQKMPGVLAQEEIQKSPVCQRIVPGISFGPIQIREPSNEMEIPIGEAVDQTEELGLKIVGKMDNMRKYSWYLEKAAIQAMNYVDQCSVDRCSKGGCNEIYEPCCDVWDIGPDGELICLEWDRCFRGCTEPTCTNPGGEPPCPIGDIRSWTDSVNSWFSQISNEWDRPLGLNYLTRSYKYRTIFPVGPFDVPEWFQIIFGKLEYSRSKLGQCLVMPSEELEKLPRGASLGEFLWSCSTAKSIADSLPEKELPYKFPALFDAQTVKMPCYGLDYAFPQMAENFLCCESPQEELPEEEPIVPPPPPF